MAVVVFVVILAVFYLSIIKLLKVDVVFYSSLQAAAAASLLLAILMFGTALFSALSGFERGQLLVICALLGYVLAISVPTVIDRSLSFYILEKLQQRGGAIRLDRFEHIFTGEYIREHKLVDVRLTEQVESGTIVIDGNCVVLTPRGDRLAAFGRFFRTNLLPRKRLLRGEYTDQLTDPFRRSDENPDYLCEPWAGH
ncbi:hypothetical protein GCM10023332_01480 [Luteimonas vadosa]|uniref:DUF421 domain-containing protein n=2 Tax=Luteimonas vadosa TaxID=1165507 RepID=A0ABP9DN17_9GAMM